ncbi:uncharacterized protein LOC127789795 isoform X2 [Diospyros lotus]|uniref:uncharacterized protein LOC127789795 isoform X2 n=1 Tax=Diospyros lotus TaxID=55363 RepID=UPI002259D059|nr:uncharacterized protein LOC127789795 isoform X2 [Diospyros lotus]
MPRQNRVGNGLILGSSKIRKRTCFLSASPAPQNYRFKRAVFVGRTRESSTRFSTPVPAWRTAANVDSLMGDRSVRKLVASLREMNDVPYPMVRENLEATKFFRRGIRVGSARSGSQPCHLSDPSHRPVSEKMDRSGTGTHHRRTTSNSHRLRLSDHNVGAVDSLSCASLMEVQ